MLSRKSFMAWSLVFCLGTCAYLSTLFLYYVLVLLHVIFWDASTSFVGNEQNLIMSWVNFKASMQDVICNFKDGIPIPRARFSQIAGSYMPPDQCVL